MDQHCSGVLRDAAGGILGRPLIKKRFNAEDTQRI
jgi:hypothetical protein